MNIIVDRNGLTLTKKDKEMDYRAEEAVAAAIHKARVLNKPIACFDKKIGKAFLEYGDGHKEYIENDYYG